MNDPVDVRWSNQKGWIAFVDPATGRWDEVWARDVPCWRQILVARLRANGWVPRHHDDDDDATPEQRFRCSCGQEHAACVFGLGLDCANGSGCANPHHFDRGAACPT